jgi:hypothetical protein
MVQKIGWHTHDSVVVIRTKTATSRLQIVSSSLAGFARTAEIMTERRNQMMNSETKSRHLRDSNGRPQGDRSDGQKYQTSHFRGQ